VITTLAINIAKGTTNLTGLRNLWFIILNLLVISRCHRIGKFIEESCGMIGSDQRG